MDDAAYWLALKRAPGLRGQVLERLLEAFPEPRELFEAAGRGALPSGLDAATIAYLRSPDWAALEPDLDWLGCAGHHLITLGDPRFPSLLREIGDPPLFLFASGNPRVLSYPQLAMVGSRHPTPGGVETAYGFAEHLAASGLTITSGLALGIDGASHRGALAGGGTTIGVVGTGLDRVYPSRHRDLAHQVVQNGVMVSEYPLGTPPRAGHFPRRNRIIAGLSLGTLVVEAARNSGALITARLAAEQGREVFAIPGSIHNPLARGCHGLIREGAKLVETAQDITEELPETIPAAGPALASDGSEPAQAPGAADEALDADYHRLLDAMGFDPISVDMLVERSGLTAEVVSSMLLLLELRGHVAPFAGGFYTRVSRGV